MGRTLLILLLAATAATATAQDSAPEPPRVPLATARANERGNELLAEGRFDEAARVYREEALKRPENGILQRNLAGALVRSGQADEGLAAYGQAIRFAKTREGKAAALYDLGNSLALAGQFEPALQTYASAMMMAPEDMDIRHNYEFVLEQLQQQEQQQQQEEQNPKDGDEDQEQQPQPDPNQQGEEEKPQDDPEQRDQQQTEENPAEQQQPQPAEPTEGEAMDPEDAKRLLDAMLEEEKELQAERNKQVQPRNPNVEKDW